MFLGVDDSLAHFYAASYRRVVGQVALLTGSRLDAEECVQEAVVRLVPRWSKVSQYDDPEAWLRRVAMRVATGRWRRARVAASHLGALGRAVPNVAAPDSVAVDLQRALLALPLGQRQVVVLHYLVGLPVEDVARELRLPAGTVKSRLSRARTALAVLLSEEIPA